MVWLCRFRASLLLILALGFVVLVSVPAMSGSGSKPSHDPAATGNMPSSQTPQSALTDAQRQLCQTAFSNGSGTKFTDEAAFEAACLELFPPQIEGEGDSEA